MQEVDISGSRCNTKVCDSGFELTLDGDLALKTVGVQAVVNPDKIVSKIVYLMASTLCSNWTPSKYAPYSQYYSVYLFE